MVAHRVDIEANEVRQLANDGVAWLENTADVEDDGRNHGSRGMPSRRQAPGAAAMIPGHRRGRGLPGWLIVTFLLRCGAPCRERHRPPQGGQEEGPRWPGFGSTHTGTITT